MSVEVPWWAQSPSPYTIIYWGLLILYGASRFKPKGFGEWANRFWDAGLIWGLVLFPIDIMWLVSQWLRFGYLYPEEWVLIVICLIRDGAAIIICIVLSWDKFRLPQINLGGFKNLVFAIPFYAVWFLEAPNPSVTDWTYAIRFGYGWDRVWTSFFISHVLLKIIQAAIYLSLWRKFTHSPVYQVSSPNQ